MASEGRNKLSAGIKAAYGVCDLGGNLFFTAIAFVLPIFFTDTVGLTPLLASIVLPIGKFLDAVTDPVVGYMSDHTKTPWGKRRPYILAGALPTGVFMFLLFTMPGHYDMMTNFILAAVFYCFLSVFYAVMNIPYSAMMSELTKDYNERTSLNGYRMSFAIIGSFLGAGAALPIVNAFTNKAAGFSFMGGLFGFLILATALVTFFIVKEPAVRKAPMSSGVFKTYLAAFKSVPFLTVVFGGIMHIIGITILSGTLAYYFKYIYRQEGLTAIATLVLLLTAIIFIPLWVFISKKIGKKICMIVGMLIIVFALFMLYLFARPLGVPFFVAFMVVAGIGLSTQYVFPYSLLADVVEQDYSETGVRKDGVFFGLWIFSSKIGQAVAGWLIGFMLGLFHYIPNTAQTEEAISGIRVLFGPIPLLIYFAGAVIMFFYPITKKKYEEVLKKISKMKVKA